MQEIADSAGINKAMLHYYYRSKEKLFESVFEEALERIFPKVNELLDADMPLFDKIGFFIENYITILMENTYMPVFIAAEINQNPGRLIRTLKKKKMLNPQIFIKQIKEASEKGKIKKIDPRELIINMISLCIFPVIWKPVLTEVLGYDEKSFKNFMNQRKKAIPELIISSITKSSSKSI